MIGINNGGMIVGVYTTGSDPPVGHGEGIYRDASVGRRASLKPCGSRVRPAAANARFTLLTGEPARTREGRLFYQCTDPLLLPWH